jgi:hypothetical protein
MKKSGYSIMFSSAASETEDSKQCNVHEHKTLDVQFIVQLMFAMLCSLWAVQYRIQQLFRRSCSEGNYPRNK